MVAAVVAASASDAGSATARSSPTACAASISNDRPSGGVAVSGLEQSQNSLRLAWGREEVDQRLQGIMSKIHSTCVEHGAHKDHVEYLNLQYDNKNKELKDLTEHQSKDLGEIFNIYE